MRAAILSAAIATIVLSMASAAAAQPRPSKTQARPPRPFVEHGFLTLTLGMQAPAEDLTTRVEFEANAETGSLSAVYPDTAGVIVDGAAGFRLRRQLGIALAVSRGSTSAAAEVSASIPHPFFDDRDRTVEGSAPDITRTETAVHVQVYYDVRPRGAWRVRLFGGPSYFSVAQELVTSVQAIESFPYDTAEFGSATTTRANGSGVGFHGGLDVSRLLTRRAGITGVVRFARGSVDLDGTGPTIVSTEAGGLQAAAGLRILF